MHNRFEAFFGQKSKEHLQTTKKHRLEAKHKYLFMQMCLKKVWFARRVSPEGFPASFLAKSADQFFSFFFDLPRTSNRDSEGHPSLQLKCYVFERPSGKSKPSADQLIVPIN